MSTKQQNSISLKTPEEIEIMHQANQIVAGVLNLLQKLMSPGLSTMQLDKMAEEYCRDHGAEPAFKGYHGFPASLCISINEQIVHGIPSEKVQLQEGDIVSVDFGSRYKGYYGDSALTIPVGRISKENSSLLLVTQEALEQGIKKVQVGNRITDISRAIQKYVEKHDFSVVRKFVGHGIGRSLHEEPEVPNFVDKHDSPRIIKGMVLAIEPMVNVGTHRVMELKDGWTVITADGKPSAHFEHSVAATADGSIVLSRREDEMSNFNYYSC